VSTCEACGGRFKALARHVGHCQPERDAEVVRRYAENASLREIERGMNGVSHVLAKARA
jgi:hypothetical protein